MPDFRCVQCNKTKPIHKHGATGYARCPEGCICYDCCAKRDKEYMRREGKDCGLYLVRVPCDPVINKRSKWQVTNWPGTLRFDAIVRQSDHNFAGKNGRFDAWFIFEGFIWHGVNIGDHQICRCKRTRRRAESWQYTSRGRELWSKERDG